MVYSFEKVTPPPPPRGGNDSKASNIKVNVTVNLDADTLSEKVRKLIEQEIRDSVKVSW